MPIVTLEQARLHLRVDGEDEDSLIALFITTAGEQVQEYLNRQVFADLVELNQAVAAGTGGDRPMLANASTQAAALLIIGRLYACREDDAKGGGNEFPQASRRLLDPYRIGQGV